MENVYDTVQTVFDNMVDIFFFAEFYSYGLRSE